MNISKINFISRAKPKSNFAHRKNEEQNKYSTFSIQKYTPVYFCALNARSGNKITPYKVDEKNIKDFLDFLYSKNQYYDNIIKKADFTSFEKSGMALKYSRKDFLSDLYRIINKCNDCKRNEIFSRLEIKPVSNNEGLIGYDGIINLENLNREDEIQNRVFELANEFIFNNSAASSDKNLNEAMNLIFSSIPEFMNIVGKQQHIMQSYSLDIHILYALNRVMNDSRFDKLNESDRAFLKFGLIMHDIAKPEYVNKVDHQIECAQYTKEIIKKYPFDDDFKERLVNFIGNHHWLRDYNIGGKTAAQTAQLFYRKNDWNLAKIMSEADLKASGISAYMAWGYSLADYKMEPVDNEVLKLKSLYKN